MKIKEVREWIKDKNDEETFILLVDKNTINTKTNESYLMEGFTLNTKERMDSLTKEFDVLVDELYKKAVADNPDWTISSSTMHMDTTQFKLTALAALEQVRKEEVE